MNFYINIGQHLMLIKCCSSNLAKGLIKNFNVIGKYNNDELDLSINIYEGYGVPFLDYKVEVIRSKDKLFYKRADYLVEIDAEFKNATIKVHNDLALKHALMNLYSSFIVHHKWGLLIHSSCVKENGTAHIFSGHSGAGKSTAARLSQPRELLSDEATIVKITSEEVLVFNSPFNSELDSNCKDSSLPLSSIQLLHQSLQNKRIKLKKADGLLHLLDKVFFWEYSDVETRKVLDLLKYLVQTVPIYELHFQKNDTFWELIS
ncbi:hypothetical protein [Bacillus timonensis]|uniref:hypothetical protein n=1 Tax=Bacillus timonensis TaxID=1033734 RepID=UPI000288D9FD|nr:hypothetical protein [Bacillus timonensis]